MNLVYGEIVDVEVGDGMRFGNVTVSGAMKKVPLDLVQDVGKGDKVLLCDGVAIAKVEKTQSTESTHKGLDSFGFRRSSCVI